MTATVYQLCQPAFYRFCISFFEGAAWSTKLSMINFSLGQLLKLGKEEQDLQERHRPHYQMK